MPSAYSKWYFISAMIPVPTALIASPSVVELIPCVSIVHSLHYHAVHPSWSKWQSIRQCLHKHLYLHPGVIVAHFFHLLWCLLSGVYLCNRFVLKAPPACDARGGGTRAKSPFTPLSFSAECARHTNTIVRQPPHTILFPSHLSWERN